MGIQTVPPTPEEEILSVAREYVEMQIVKLREDFLAQLKKTVDNPTEGYDFLDLWAQVGDDPQMKKQLIYEDFAAWIEGYEFDLEPPVPEIPDEDNQNGCPND